MGNQARRRAEECRRQEELLSGIDISRVARAVRQVALFKSAHPGQDCYLHAVIGKRILELLGVASHLAMGIACWRVGEGDGDVITHSPDDVMVPQVGTFFHTWLEIGHYILDLTTYQLPMKATRLEQLDGIKTSVVWCPDYLLAKRETVSPSEDVRMKHAGLYHYKRSSAIEGNPLIKAFEVSEDILDLAWALYNNPVTDCYWSMKAA